MKHIKTLGLLAVAVMALAAFFGTASASAAKFTAGKVGATITEETIFNHVFTITGSNAECTTIGFAGATEALETQSQKVTPSYSGCTAFGFAATVTNNNCQYTLHAGGEMRILNSVFTCSLIIKVNNFFAQCEATIGPQFLPGAVSYTNSETLPRYITVRFNTLGVSAKVLKSSGLCPLTVGTHAASYTGESRVRAEGAYLEWDA